MATENNKSVFESTDQEVIDRVVPRWAQTLNWIYEHTFGPLDRLVEYLKGSSTRQFIADFEAAEARNAN